MRASKCQCLMWLSVLGLLLMLMPHRGDAAEVKTFRLVNVLVGKTKIWLPSTITVQAGDEVELILDNTLSAPHGFKLPPSGIEVEVPSLQKKTVKFTAGQAGVHDFHCQLHKGHVGGQIVVLKP